MAMMNADDSSLYQHTHSPSWLQCFLVGRLILVIVFIPSTKIHNH